MKSEALFFLTKALFKIIFMKNTGLFLLLLMCCGVLQAQSEFADVLVDSNYSGSNPDWDEFYGGEVNGGCDEVATDPSVVLGDNDFFVSLPTGSSITVQFVDNCLVDAPGQTDLFLEEVGASSELADVWVSDDGIDFTYFGMIDGGVVNELDLADINYDSFVKYVRIEGLDAGGCVPGFDIVRIYGLPGSNCEAFAGLSQEADSYCTTDGAFPLQDYVFGSPNGVWSGAGQNGGIVNPQELGEGTYTFTYTVEDPLPICPGDAQSITLTIEDCAVFGCIDPTSCTFDALANTDDGSCQYLDCTGICGGANVEGAACDDNDATTVNDIYDADCGCSGVIVLGCIDPVSCTFEPGATVDDGSCLYLDCEGTCGGAALAGTVCDDNDDQTIEDVYQADCSCLGVPIFQCDGELDTLPLNRQGSLCADLTEFPIDGNEVYTWYNENDEVVAVFTGIQYYAPSVLGAYYVVVTDPDYPICSQVLGPRTIETIDGCCELDGATLDDE